MIATNSKPQYMKPIFYIIFLFLIACTTSEKKESIFIKDGKTLAVFEDFEKWERKKGFLQGKKQNNMLYAKNTIDEKNDFEIDLEFAFHPKNKKNELFLELGTIKIWLKRIKQNTIVTALEPGKGDTLFHISSEIQEKSKFQLQINRKNQNIHIALNNIYLGSFRAYLAIKGNFGIFPAKGILKMYNFKASGKGIQKLKKNNNTFTTVFKRGEQGYSCFRIPAIVKTKSGKLLAFCEGRKNSRSDYGDIDLVMKSSFDNGQTWQNFQIVKEEGGNEKIEIASPTPVVDEKNNRVHLIYTRKYRDLYHCFSDNEGETWSKPKPIISASNERLFKNHFVSSSPGHAIQTQTGKLLIPVWIKDTIENPNLDKVLSASIFSDDGGKTWQTNPPIDSSFFGSNEHQIANLFNGNVISVIRVKDYKSLKKRISISSDEGKTWTKPRIQKELIDPVCQASIVLHPKKNILYFTNPANKQYFNRSNLVLKTSKDNGQTWQTQKTIYPRQAAYSDLVFLSDTTLGCLFEQGHFFQYESIVFERIKIDSFIKSK